MKKPATAIAVAGLVGSGSVADPVQFHNQVISGVEFFAAAVRVIENDAPHVHGISAHFLHELDFKGCVVGRQELEGGAHGGDGLGAGVCAHAIDTNRLALTCQHVRQRKTA